MNLMWLEIQHGWLKNKNKNNMNSSIDGLVYLSDI
jgi:hypothetical protein